MNTIFNMPEQELNPPEGDSLVTQDDINNAAFSILEKEEAEGKLSFIDHDAYLFVFAADTLAILKSTETDRNDKLFDIECLRDKYQTEYLSDLADTEYYKNKARSNLGVY